MIETGRSAVDKVQTHPDEFKGEGSNKIGAGGKGFAAGWMLKVKHCGTRRGSIQGRCRTMGGRGQGHCRSGREIEEGLDSIEKIWERKAKRSGGAERELSHGTCRLQRENDSTVAPRKGKTIARVEGASGEGLF